MIMDTRLKELVQAGQASQLDFERLGVDQVREVKSDAESVQLRCCSHEAKAVSGKERTLRFVFSDESVDSYGDIIKQDGWDLSRYTKNPVILWAHNGTDNPPIGRASNVHVSNGMLIGDIEFAPKGAFEFAETLYQLALEKFIKGNSVGFQPIKIAEQKDAEAAGVGKYGVLFEKQLLLENSLVSVGANENALQNGLKSLVQRGLVDDRTSRNFAKTYPLTEMDWRKTLREKVRSFVDMGANTHVETANTAHGTDALIAEFEKNNQATRAWIEAATQRLTDLSIAVGGAVAPDQTNAPEQREAGYSASDLVVSGFDATAALERIKAATNKGEQS